MSEKNMLAILGSPHTNGMTAAMLNWAVHKAEQAGYAVTKINLYEKKLSFCTGCRACMDTHICIQKDDIQEIAPLLHKSQFVILAAPVYWANVPASVKNLFDRLLGTAMEETIPTFYLCRTRYKSSHNSDNKMLLLLSCDRHFPVWLQIPAVSLRQVPARTFSPGKHRKTFQNQPCLPGYCKRSRRDNIPFAGAA